MSFLFWKFGGFATVLGFWVWFFVLVESGIFLLFFSFSLFVWFHTKLIFSCLVLLCAGLQAVVVKGECFHFVPSRVLER